MRIAFFTDTYYPDLNGVSVSVSNFASKLRRKGHTVFIFAPKIKGKYKDTDEYLVRLSSVKIIPNSEPQIYSPTIWPNKEFRKMFREKFDIIHAHGNGPYSLLGYSIAKIKRTPFVMTFHVIHTHYIHYIFKGKFITPKMIYFAFKTFAKRCKAVITPSLKMKNELLKYGVKKKIYVVPNFLDMERFKNKKSGYLHKLLNLPPKTPLIVTVGRIGKEKNIDFILRVFKKLCENDRKPHMVVIGKGPEKNNLIDVAYDLGIMDRTHFTGAIDYESMPLVYKDATIFVFASYTETQGICVLEAAATGIPCVLNNDPAYKNMVINNKNGFLVALDEKKFANKINLLLKDKSLRKQMSKKSIEIASTNFNAEKITDDLISIYSKVINA